jgi:hypothetical protein
MIYSKLRDWYADGKGYARERDVVGTLQTWFDKGNLVVTHGDGKNVEEIFGLPYTSTSEFAAIWNCNAEAVLKEKPCCYFDGCAITEGNRIVAIFTARDEEGNEIGEYDLIID